jgi:4-hydroxy-3-polyprenylbenzoate decarboxylase
MAFRSLRDFLRLLEERGELHRIRAPVDRDLEITEIADRTTKAGGPALLFENVNGFETPVLINTFGSERRTAWALGGESLEGIASRIRELLEMQPPGGSLVEKIRTLPKLAELARIMPKRVRTGPVKEVVERDAPSLSTIPVLRCWPLDAGRTITLPGVYTRDPETGITNVGMYRMQVYDDRTTGMHWQTHKVGREHHRKHAERSRRTEVAAVLGGPPAAIYSASAPLPPGIPELALAGFLNGEAIEVTPCETVDLEVPAHAEYVLEGWVDPDERRLEGPFGDHTGYYSLAEEYPVFHLTCITRRKDPLYPTIVVGRPIQEDCYLGKATVRLFLPAIQAAFPEIVDMNLPFEGIFHNLVLVSMRKRYPGHALKLMHGLWGFGQLMFSKCIIVVDHDVDVQNIPELVWRVTNNIDARRDVTFVEGPVDDLDHASRRPKLGSKMGIDATRKLPEEGFEREWPPDIAMSEEVKARVDELWGELGISLPPRS